MNQEKHDDTDIPQVQENKSAKGKPVVVYIMILFIAAFLLMTLSLFMHQRSNSETLGALQSSVSAIQAAQTTQERVIALQEELNKTTEALNAAEDALAALQDTHESETQDLQRQLDAESAAYAAMTNLYLLEQAYHAEDYTSCHFIIQFMEERGQPDVLAIEGAAEGHFPEDVVNHSFWNPPRLRFDHIKTDVEAKLTETAP